jgi:hypothetical protein
MANRSETEMLDIPNVYILFFLSLGSCQRRSLEDLLPTPNIINDLSIVDSEESMVTGDQLEVEGCQPGPASDHA